jgi:pyruvate dehydrogenase E2 component (dihydrolipoamide acetyltransferase)
MKCEFITESCHYLTNHHPEDVNGDEGDDIPVLQGVAIIGTAGEDISALLSSQPQANKPAADEAPAAASPVTASAAAEIEVTTPIITAGEYGVSPRARHLADRMGLDANEAAGSGPNGRVIERDIYALADGVKRTAPTADTGDYTDEKLSLIRRRIAESMHKSLSEMAQLTHHSSFDASAIQAYRARMKAEGSNITLNDMILFAVSRVLLDHPDLNAHFLGDKMRRFCSVNLGVAVDTDRGLMVPTLFGADRLPLAELARAAKKLAEQCRAGSINPDALSGGTFTVSNLGILGVEMFTPVINPPQTAILGVCNIIDRPRRSAAGYLEIYPAMGLSLTYDHRAVDGAPASRYLRDVCKALEQFDDLVSK